MTFYREKPIKAIRKARPCMGCGRVIETGSTALGCAGVWQGDFWAGAFHPDCRNAEIAMNDLHDLNGDEWINLADIEWDDWPWLIQKFPAVASRMGITTGRYTEASQRHRSFFTPNRSEIADV